MYKQPSYRSAGSFDRVAFPSSPSLELAPWSSLGEGLLDTNSVALALVLGSFGFLSSQLTHLTAW